MNHHRSQKYSLHALKHIILTGVAVLMLLPLAQCKKGDNQQQRITELEINYPAVNEGEYWVAYSYYAHHIEVDTLSQKHGNISWKVKIDRDSLDAIVLYDDSALPIAPLLSLEEKKASIKQNKRNNSVNLVGIKEALSIEQWLQLRSLCKEDISDTPDEVLHFLKEQKSSVVAPVIARALRHRYPNDKHSYALDSLMRAYTSQRRDILDALAISRSSLPEQDRENRIRIPNILSGTVGDGDNITIKKLRKNAEYVVVQALSPFTTNKEDSIFGDVLMTLDTLKVATYTILPERNDAPADWLRRALAEKKNDKVAHLFEVDSIGAASNLLSKLNIGTLPFYAVVDTNIYTAQIWFHPDSLIQYLQKRDPEE